MIFTSYDPISPEMTEMFDDFTYTQYRRWALENTKPLPTHVSNMLNAHHSLNSTGSLNIPIYRSVVENNSPNVEGVSSDSIFTTEHKTFEKDISVQNNASFCLSNNNSANPLAFSSSLSIDATPFFPSNSGSSNSSSSSLNVPQSSLLSNSVQNSVFPVAYFRLNSETGYSVNQRLRTVAKGRYILIKLIRSEAKFSCVSDEDELSEDDNNMNSSEMSTLSRADGDDEIFTARVSGSRRLLNRDRGRIIAGGNIDLQFIGFKGSSGKQSFSHGSVN